jgi:hypothetical protein
LVADADSENPATLPSIFKDDRNFYFVQARQNSKQSPKKQGDFISLKNLRNLEQAVEPTFDQIIRA